MLLNSFTSSKLRIKYDANSNRITPFDEDIIIDYKPSIANPITISFPLIPSKFYNKKEMEFIQEKNPELLNKLRSNFNPEIIDGVELIPKKFEYSSDDRVGLIKQKRYEFRCMLEGTKIYYPTIKDTLDNFKLINRLFKDCFFTIAFLEAFKNKIEEKIEIQEAKKIINVYNKDANLIPTINKNWNTQFLPFNHQKIMLEYSTKLPYFANLSEMGTGKTYPTIVAIKERIRNGSINRAFVICPKSISNSVWKKQIEIYSDLKAMVIEGTEKERHIILNQKVDVFIIGYELFNVMKEEILPLCDNKTMVILDESSKIKNPIAKRSKAIHQLGRMVKYKIILNGTPITQGAQDIFSQFLFLDNGNTFGGSFDGFLQKYFSKEQYSWKWAIKNKEAMQEISDCIYNLGVRFLKSECLDLPPKLYEQREIQLTDDQFKAYCSMRDMLIAWIENEEKEKKRIDAQIIVTKLLRLSQITSGFSKDEFGKIVKFKENPKLKELNDDLDNILYNGNQLVIWARFVNDIQSIAKLLEEKKISYGLCYGKVKDADRSKAVDDFLNKRIKVFVGQQGSGGLGIDLYTANTVIYFSNDYTLLNRLQSEDRTHRKGSEQHNKVTYIDYIAVGPDGEATIDYHILGVVLKEKKNVADIITKDNLRKILGLTGYNISNKPYLK